ncbi:hypothetical protein RhiJN_05678 [Ceratobasidium sp. AG-Ba]|nr:hypothetical protein RhiJN_05678 [Ceratobasidium sp. AG-Ba]QRW06608.1 F-box-like protein [Ceratobasidium sp. AG-Ba]
MYPPNTQLPVEILFHILLSSNFPLADLATFSKVCRQWYRILFPALYDTVYLSWDVPVFAARILYEHIPQQDLPITPTRLGDIRPAAPINGFRVTDYIKKLILDNRVNRQRHGFCSLESAIVAAALPKLIRLKSIEWALPWLPEKAEMFSVLSQHCKKIEHISFDIPININRYNDDQFTHMFSFANLKHIRIKDLRLAHDPETNGHIPPSLIRMMVSSPELEHLELELQENPQNEGYEEIGWLVEAIAPVLAHTFPNLKTFSLKGTANIDSEFFVNAGENSDIRSFLFRHPNLHTLELPWDWSMNALIHEPLQLATTALRGVLPNLRRFSGPTYLVALFLKLDFARGLEHLAIHDTADDEESDLSKFARSFPRLPNLQRLDFLSSYMLDSASFFEVVKATPNITELTLLWVDGDPETTRVALTSLAKLRALNLGFNVLPHLCNRSQKYVSKEQESHEVFELARQCPSLKFLRIYPEEDTPGGLDHQICWYIQRCSTGVINITFSGPLEWSNIGGDLMSDVGYYQRLYKVFTEQYWGFTPTIEV